MKKLLDREMPRRGGFFFRRRNGWLALLLLLIWGGALTALALQKRPTSPEKPQVLKKPFQAIASPSPISEELLCAETEPSFSVQPALTGTPVDFIQTESVVSETRNVPAVQPAIFVESMDILPGLESIRFAPAGAISSPQANAEIEPVRSLGKWSFVAQAGLEIPVRAAGPGFAASLRLNRKIGAKWSMEGGLGYYNLGQPTVDRSSLGYSADQGIDLITNFEDYSPVGTPTNSYDLADSLLAENNFPDRLRYLTIPLEASRKLGSRWSVFGGTQFLFRLEPGQQRDLAAALEAADPLAEAVQTSLTVRRFDWQATIGLRYLVADRITVDLTYRHGMRDVQPGLQLPQFNRSLGLSARVIF